MSAQGGLQLLFRWLAEGRATCSVPEAGQVMGFGPSKSYEMANQGSIPTLGKKYQRVVPLPLLAQKLGYPITLNITVTVDGGEPVHQTSFTCEACDRTYLIPGAPTRLEVMLDHYDECENAAWAKRPTPHSWPGSAVRSPR